MSQQEAGNGLVVCLALTGLASGLLTCLLMDPRAQQADTYTGIIFGVSLAAPLLLYEVLDKPWKALGLVVGTTIAYPCSAFAAIAFQMGFPQIVPHAEFADMGTVEPASPVALFVGGFAGGFIVFSAVALFCRRGIGHSVGRMQLQGALLSGTLGFVAWVLRSSIGAALWHMYHALGMIPSWEHSPREWFHNEYEYGKLARLYALYITWQAGVATAIGIMLRRITIEKEEESASVLPPFNSR